MLNQSINKQTMSKIVTLLLLTLVSIVVNAQQQLNTAVQVVVDTNNASAATQTRIDELTAKYRNVLNEIESLREYNKQLEAVVNDQRAQIVSIEQQMTSLEQTNRGVVPMIIEMIDSLGQLVEADIPFLKEERLDRVAELEGMIGSQAYTTSELYRKVTEAYGIELDYGSTVESYQDALPNGKEVDFLRVGRTTLIYQTLNQEVSGWWNSSTGQFEELDKRYNAEIKEAIRIAKKQASPDLTGLPVFAADNAGGQ